MIKVILAAKDIPAGATVTKIGTRPDMKKYVLQREIKIYGVDQKPITAENMLFLCCDRGISAIEESTELIWEVESLFLLQCHLEGRMIGV